MLYTPGYPSQFTGEALRKNERAGNAGAGSTKLKIRNSIIAAEVSPMI
jgi:hypothetical protein